MVAFIIDLKPKIIKKRQMELRVLESKRVPRKVEKGIQENPLKEKKFQID